MKIVRKRKGKCETVKWRKWLERRKKERKKAAEKKVNETRGYIERKKERKLQKKVHETRGYIERKKERKKERKDEWMKIEKEKENVK